MAWLKVAVPEVVKAIIEVLPEVGKMVAAALLSLFLREGWSRLMRSRREARENGRMKQVMTQVWRELHQNKQPTPEDEKVIEVATSSVLSYLRSTFEFPKYQPVGGAMFAPIHFAGEAESETVIETLRPKDGALKE